MWREEFQRKLSKWRELSPEAKHKAIVTIFKKFEEKAKGDKLKTLFEFMKWLQSPEGAIIFPYLWKDEYREVMIDIAYYSMRIFYKVLGAKE